MIGLEWRAQPAREPLVDDDVLMGGNHPFTRLVEDSLTCKHRRKGPTRSEKIISLTAAGW